MFELHDISYRTHSGVTLLKNVTVAVSPNALTAVMGLNGAGKTTLLKILSRYLKPAQGAVFLDGNNLNNFSAKELARHIAYVPQDFPTDFPFTVFEFVMMGRFAWQDGLFAHPSDEAMVRAILSRLDLQSRSDSSILCRGAKGSAS
jgi:iron complex transport system ATP-binding protein